MQTSSNGVKEQENLGETGVNAGPPRSRFDQRGPVSNIIRSRLASCGNAAAFRLSVLVNIPPRWASLVKHEVMMLGFRVATATSTKECLAAVGRCLEPAHTVLILVWSSAWSYRSLIRQIRWLHRKRPHTPILLLGDEVRPEVILGAVRCGATDFVNLDSSPAECRARFAAPFFKLGHQQIVNSLHVTVDSRTVYGDAGSVQLTDREYAVLCTLHDNRERPTPRAALLRAVWRREAADAEGRLSIVDVYISSLRRKLMHCCGGGEVIRTIRGIGYVLVADVKLAAR